MSFIFKSGKYIHIIDHDFVNIVFNVVSRCTEYRKFSSDEEKLNFLNDINNFYNNHMSFLFYGNTKPHVDNFK
jgi:hypothetical protein